MRSANCISTYIQPRLQRYSDTRRTSKNEFSRSSILSLRIIQIIEYLFPRRLIIYIFRYVIYVDGQDEDKDRRMAEDLLRIIVNFALSYFHD
jgi:hypothetical protein